MPAAGAAEEQQRAAGPHPADGVLRHRDGQPLVPGEVADRPLVLKLRQGRVVRYSRRDHHVVERLRQLAEEPVERRQVRRVERRGLERPDFVGGVLQLLRVAAGEDDVGALVACFTGRLESHARAAADHHDGLPGQ